MNDKYIELAKKLQALAVRGVGGEQMNAKEKLSALMAKHNISLDDLDEDKVRYYAFDYTEDRNSFKMLIHVLTLVLNEKPVRYGRDKQNPNAFPYRIFVRCSLSQSMEVEIKYNIYYKALQDEIDILYTAFIEKNYIFPSFLTPGNMHDLSPEEQSRVMRSKAMSDMVNVVEIHKNIENK